MPSDREKRAAQQKARRAARRAGQDAPAASEAPETGPKPPRAPDGASVGVSSPVKPPQRSVLDLAPHEQRRQVLARLWKEATEGATSSDRQKALKLIDELNKDQPPAVSVPAGEGPVPAARSEWARLLRQKINASSLRTVAEQLGVTHAALGKITNGWTVPREPLLEAVRDAFSIDPEDLHRPACPPPPPTQSEVLSSLNADRGFTHFVEHGPLALPLTRPQRVLCLICFEGVDPSQLEPEDRAIAHRLLGGTVDVIPAEAREDVFLRLGRNSAKSTLAACYLSYRALTADLTTTGAHEEPAAVCFSRNARTSGIVFKMVQAILATIPSVVENVESENARDIVFARPLDGRTIRISLVVRSAGGLGVRGYPIVGAVFDEAEFSSQSQVDAAVRDEDTIAGMKPRFTRGAQLLSITTPWPAESYARSRFLENHGHPKTAIAMMGTSLVMRANDPDVARRRAKGLASQNPEEVESAKREFDCIETAATGALLKPERVLGAVRTQIQQTRSRAVAGADIAFINDASALVIGERQGGALVIVKVEIRRPENGRPLQASIVVGEFARIAREAGATFLACADTHQLPTVRREAHVHGLQVVDMPASQEENYFRLAALFNEGRIIIADDPILIRQLRAIGTRKLPGGETGIVMPRSRELAHLDAASALVACAWYDSLVNGAYPTQELQRFAPAVYETPVVSPVPSLAPPPPAAAPSPAHYPNGGAVQAGWVHALHFSAWNDWMPSTGRRR
jgi:hypothetical protein